MTKFVFLSTAVSRRALSVEVTCNGPDGDVLRFIVRDALPEELSFLERFRVNLHCTQRDWLAGNHAYVLTSLSPETLGAFPNEWQVIDLPRAVWLSTYPRPELLRESIVTGYLDKQPPGHFVLVIDPVLYDEEEFPLAERGAYLYCTR